MKRVLILALCAGVALTACSKEEMTEAAVGEIAAEAPAADVAAAPEVVSTTEEPSPEAPVASRTAEQPKSDKAAQSTVPALAYQHRYRIEAPAKAIDVLVGKHEAACQAAGPTVCQVTQASVNRESKRHVTGTLSLRARADWLATFRAGLAADADGVGGSIETSGTATDDLSRAMIDNQAAIRAKIIMRDRLETMLRTRSGKIEELMEVERQLAEVRSEIDAAQSGLAGMKTRVAMSALTIDYGTKGSLAQDGAWAPVGDAVRASQGLMANVISALILIIAGLTPIAGVAAAVVFVVRRLRKPRPAPAPAA